MLTAREIVGRKGTQVYATSPDATVFDALSSMAEKNVGALMVLEGGTLVGVFSERDYARKVILEGKFSRTISVREIMTSNPVAISPETGIAECMRIMTDRQIRHLPVVDGNTLVGVLSIGDVVKSIIDEQADSIGHLTRYIIGR